MRWRPSTWDQLNEVETEHRYKVKVNRIAEVAVNWGLAFLRTLSSPLQQRVLGIKGVKPLTFDEQEKLRSELSNRLGSLAGALRYDDRLGFALPRPIKQILREEARRSETSMSEIARTEISKRIRKEDHA